MVAILVERTTEGEIDMIRVLIVDDHAVVRLGLRALLDLEDNFSVVGEAESGAVAIVMARQEKPDVVVMDIRMPEMNGIEACQEIRAVSPETKVIMLTSYADEEAIYASIMAGAAGYVLKQLDNALLIDSIKRVAEGETLLDSNIIKNVMERMKAIATEKENEAKLTDAERKIDRKSVV